MRKRHLNGFERCEKCRYFNPFSEAVDFVKDRGSSAVHQVKKFVEGTGENIEKAFSTAGNAVGNTIEKYTPDKIKDITQKAGDILKGSGNNIANAFSSVTEAGNWAGDKMYSITNDNLGINTDKVKEVLGVATKYTVQDFAPVLKETFTDMLKYGVEGWKEGNKYAPLIGGFIGAVMGATQHGGKDLFEAGMNVAGKTMLETDTSGKYNPEYAYKQFGFPNAEMFAYASAFDITDYSAWCKKCSEEGRNPQNYQPLKGMEWKANGFPSKEMYEIALQCGCDNFEVWREVCLKIGINPETGKPIAELFNPPTTEKEVIKAVAECADNIEKKRETKEKESSNATTTALAVVAGLAIAKSMGVIK